MPRQPPRLSRRARFLGWVREHYSTRLHMTVILLLVVLSGLLATRLLLYAGLRSMPLRYGLVVLLGYGVFFGAVRLWIWAVHRGGDDEDVTEVFCEVGEDAIDFAGDAAEAVESAGGLTGEIGGGASELAEAAGEAGEAAEAVGEAGEAAAEGSTSLAEGIGGLFEGADEGIAVVVVVIVLVAILALLLGAGIWLVWEAPLILSEAAAEVVLAVSLRGPARTVMSTNWVGSVLRTTYRQALIVLILAVAAGFVLAAICPGAAKASEAVRTCLLSG